MHYIPGNMCAMLIIITGFTNHNLVRTGIDALHHASQYPAFIVSLLPSDLGFKVYKYVF